MKTNLCLGLLALGLALLAYTEQHAVPPPAPAAVPQEASEPLFALQPEEIDAIRAVDQHGCMVVRRKAEMPQHVEALIDSITQARVIRHFPPASADLSSYGLAHPRRRVEVVRVNGERSQMVVMGNLNPVGNAIYARAQDGPEVLLVGSYFLTALDMALQGLRAEGHVSSDPACANDLLRSE